MVRGAALLLIAGLVLGLGLHSGVKPVRGQQVDRAAVVQQFFAASNAGDVDAAMALVTDTPSTIYVAWATCSRATPCVGPAAIRAMLESLPAIHQVTTVTNLHISGTLVTGCFEASGDRFRAAGAERIIGTFLAEVPQDKIAGFFAQTDLTDAQTALNAGGPPAQADTADVHACAP